jgi:glutamyl-tRNA synthetase
MASLFAERPLPLDEKARAILAQGGAALLGQLLPRLEGLTEWSAPAAETAVRDFAEQTGSKLGQVAQPLRAALTGRLTSPGIFDVLAVLGREESLARISDQAEAVRPAEIARH